MYWCRTDEMESFSLHVLFSPELPNINHSRKEHLALYACVSSHINHHYVPSGWNMKSNNKQWIDIWTKHFMSPNMSRINHISGLLPPWLNLDFVGIFNSSYFPSCLFSRVLFSVFPTTIIDGYDPASPWIIVL